MELEEKHHRQHQTVMVEERLLRLTIMQKVERAVSIQLHLARVIPLVVAAAPVVVKPAVVMAEVTALMVLGGEIQLAERVKELPQENLENQLVTYILAVVVVPKATGTMDLVELVAVLMLNSRRLIIPVVVAVVTGTENRAPEEAVSSSSASIRRRRHEIRTDRQRNRDKHYFPE